MKRGCKKSCSTEGLLPEYDLSKLRIVRMGPARMRKEKKDTKDLCEANFTRTLNK